MVVEPPGAADEHPLLWAIRDEKDSNEEGRRIITLRLLPEATMRRRDLSL